MSRCGEISFFRSRADGLGGRPRGGADGLAAGREPMEWEESSIEVSQPSPTEVSPSVSRPPGQQVDSARHHAGKATSFFDSSEEEEVALMTTRGELSSDSGAISPPFIYFHNALKLNESILALFFA
ncbi:hypothetical protein CEXT_6791 [Caerostris extrusa]|uniref:Uncharacterized protein n=1 Tax=Caerostris extrusa TaxID=172846 RepID=A0AAV4XLZ8_CAEEX|nr:hypothetical protein CEXT_6791 [Caerostris extrusa]